MTESVDKIWINGRFLTYPMVGVHRFARQVLCAIDCLLESGEIDRRRFHWICLAPPEVGEFPGWKWIEFRRAGRLHGNLWEQIELPWGARQGLLLNLCNIAPLAKRRQATALHDASVYAVPQAYRWLFRLKHRLVYRWIGWMTPLVFTVSHFSRAELSRYAGIPAEKMHVIHEGHEHILAVAADPEIFARKGFGATPYLLAVGGASKHKNLSAVIQALELLKLECQERAIQDLELVVVGDQFERVFQADEYSNGPCPAPAWLRYVGHVSDAELRALYERAACLVFPSRYEGFGLPPLEAMACGCPVIASRTASLPEVCGDAVLYCDADDGRDIANQVCRLMMDATLRNELIQRGFDQFPRFSWLAAARQLWHVLYSLGWPNGADQLEEW